jgi:hypothetical protein
LQPDYYISIIHAEEHWQYERIFLAIYIMVQFFKSVRPAVMIALVIAFTAMN